MKMNFSLHSINWQALASLRTVNPEVLIKRFMSLKGEERWVIVKKTASISTGVAVAGATELALSALPIPFIGKYVAPVVAGAVGVYTERKAEQLLEALPPPDYAAMRQKANELLARVPKPKLPNISFKFPKWKPLVNIPV